ncbi:MAG: terminase small subunit [Armatimonadetes bacterium]|nr:terminase small subunit [Armatimonadota bacterium]
MTNKQSRFAQEYLIDLNATQAAIRAGFSAKTAEAAGSRLLRNVKVVEAIQAGQRERQVRTQITADRVLQEVARLAFFDIRKLFDAEGNLKPTCELDEETAAALVRIDIQDVVKDGKRIGSTKRFKFADKTANLSLLMKHLGIQGTEKVEASGPNGGPLEQVHIYLPDNGRNKPMTASRIDTQEGWKFVEFVPKNRNVEP